MVLAVKRSFWSSRAVRIAAIQTATWCVYACLPLLLMHDAVTTEIVFDAGLVFALGILMAVRINRAYERWWEARTLWGTLVNASRNLAVKVRAYADPAPAEARRIHDLITGFAYALRDHLREGAKLGRLDGFDEEDGDPDHVPSDLVLRLHRIFRGWSDTDRVTQDQLRMLDLETRVFLEVAGGCERIRNTVLPPALTWVTRFAVVTFLFGVPWLLEGELGWLIIPIAGIATFLLLVLETIASALEHPFGTELNQLNLTGISQAIDASTAEILGC
jgi:putative membrane protein